MRLFDSTEDLEVLAVNPALYESLSASVGELVLETVPLFSMLVTTTCSLTPSGSADTELSAMTKPFC